MGKLPHVPVRFSDLYKIDVFSLTKSYCDGLGCCLFATLSNRLCFLLFAGAFS